MTHNPYAPPVAPVDDVVLPAAERPRPVTWAVRCCWLFVAFLLPDTLRSILYVHAAGRDTVFYFVFMFGTLALMIAVGAALFHSLGEGRRWARILLGALAVYAVYSTVNGVAGDFAVTWYFGVFYLLSTVLLVVAVLLVFLPRAANAWFRRNGRRAAP